VLKNIDPLLGPEMLRVLRAMGHGDEIAVVDGNYPAEEHAKRLIRMDGHDAPRIVDAILSVLPVDDMVPEAVFRPAAFGDPKRLEPVFGDFTAILLKHEPERKIVPLTGVDFYNRVKAAFAVVASGERRLYGNLIIRKGVIYPKGVNSE
jgi:L-fucose mutarotase